MKTITGGLAVAAAAGAILTFAPVATADPGDVGVCARLNGAPFYIGPEGYMPKPGEVITGPVTGGPCKDQPASNNDNDNKKPDTPDIPSGQNEAKPLEGSYTATVTDGGGLVDNGSTKPATFTACGPGCSHIEMIPASTDLHLQGATWTGSYDVPGAGTCTLALDNSALALTEDCSSFGMTVHYTLAKNG
jgi:hypothetical protein